VAISIDELSIDELGVIRSLQAGDRESFEELVRQHRPGLLASARRSTVNETAAEDAVQETFLRAYRNLGRLADDSRLGPWLLRILTNVCIDDANRRTRDTAKAARVFNDPVLTHGAPSIEHQLGLDHDTTDLQQALATLPEGYREALTLRFVDELSYGEVAQVSGLTEDNARARVSRARHAMRLALSGAAAVPMFVYVLFRRSDRTAHAIDRVRSQPGNSVASQAASAGAANANRFATFVSPVLESANNIVSATPMAAPILGRVAAGATLVAAATLGIASSQNTDQVAAPIVVPATSAVVVAAPVSTAAPVVVVQTTSEPAPIVTVAEVTVPPTVVADTVPVVAPVVTATTLDLTPYVAPTTVPVATTPPPPAVLGGSLSANGISVVASGPRYDISGPVTLMLGDTAIDGTIGGRIGIDESLEGESQSQLSGDLTFTTAAGEVIELRLSGYAEGMASPLGYVISGAFRASPSATGLATSGTFSGSFESAFLALTLTP